MAVSFVGYQGYIGNGGSLTASKPAGTVAGDVIVAVIISSGWFDGTETVTPSGWTLSGIGIHGSSNATKMWFYWRPVGPSDTTYLWPTMPHDYSYSSASYRGAGSVTFGTVANTTGTAPSVTAGSTGGKFLYLVGQDISNGGSLFTSVAAGWVVRGEIDRQWPASGIAERTAAATAGEVSGPVTMDLWNEPRVGVVAAVVSTAMPSSAEAVAYIYENVGIEALTPSKEGVGYVYENVGVEQGLSVKEGVVYIYEYVDTAAPRVPHLWKVFPASGVANDEVEIWCHGLIPSSTGGDENKFFLHVQVGWDGDDPIDEVYEMEQVSAATMVGASANAYNAARSIPAGEFDPNVEHWKAVVKVPASPSGIRKIRVQAYDWTEGGG